VIFKEFQKYGSEGQIVGRLDIFWCFLWDFVDFDYDWIVRFWVCRRESGYSEVYT